MADLTLIQKLPAAPRSPANRVVRLCADRATLSKRRWRGVAVDGREFGFDLDEVLVHGTPFYFEEGTQYVFEQRPEKVLEISITAPEEAARIAWGLGNLHFGVQVTPAAIRVVDDPAVRQFLFREHIDFQHVNCVFTPISAISHHHHHHDHSHSHEGQ
jgi:urease accessory protein